MKQRKQMRVYDLYRFAIVKKTSKIRGIRQYWCDRTVANVCIAFENDNTSWLFHCKDEQDHKNLIRCVNRILHFIEVEQYDVALAEYNDYCKEYHRRWTDET